MIKVSSSLIGPRWLILIIYGPYYNAALFNLLAGVNNHFLLLILPHYRSAGVTMFSDKKTTLFQKEKKVKRKSSFLLSGLELEP